MEIDAFELIRMELKYCERCGGLWVRERASAEIYCANCAAALEELQGGAARRFHRTRGCDTKLDINSQSEKPWLLLCVEGGHA